MKRNKDVDLFIVADPKRSYDMFDKLMHFMHHLNIYMDKKHEAYWRYNSTNSKNLIKVLTIGRLQLIFIYFASCRCNFHLDRNFFYNFHHVTRYRFYVYHKKLANGLYQDVWFPVYIPFAKELRIITKTVQIDDIIENDDREKYPQKHTNNITEAAPPTLQQQCLNRLMESTFCQYAKEEMKQGRLSSTYSNCRILTRQHPGRWGRVLWNVRTHRVTNQLGVLVDDTDFNLANFQPLGRPPFFYSLFCFLHDF